MSEWIKKLTGKYSEVNENTKAELAKKLAKASASSEKGKAAVTLPKAPFDIPKEEMSSKEKMKRGLYNSKLDPVGKADADIDNDGDVDKSDKYLKNRRKAISKNMKKDDVQMNPNKTEKAGEEAGSVNELKRSTMVSYADKAVKNISKNRAIVQKALNPGAGVKDAEKGMSAMKTLSKRSRGSDMYTDKMTGRGKVAPQNEDTEMPAVYARILENRAAHYKGATPPMEADDGVSPNAKKLKKDMDANKDIRTDDEKGHDDVSKAGRQGPARTMRPGDNAKGDKAPINPAKDTTKNG